MKLFGRIRRRLRVGVARDWSFVPRGTHAGGTISQLLVIAPRNIPTIDYYLRDLSAAENGQQWKVAFDSDIEQWLHVRPSEAIGAGTQVILVRMPDSRWAGVIAAAGDNVHQVIWLIDDDLPAAREDAWLPVEYRLRLLDDYLAFKRAFESLIDRVWASTALVASRFPAERVEVRPPKLTARPPNRLVTIFYHGTAAHRREHAFLLPILQQVQTDLDHTVVEVVGDHEVYRMFRSVPRVRVLHPMPWPDYLAHLHAGKYDIGLVPLLDTPFNRARSGVKALEVASIGAVGVLSRRAPYLEYEGLPNMHLVGDNAEEWVDRILELGTQCALLQ